MQIDSTKLIRVSSRYPILAVLFAIAFVALTVDGVEYPFSTLLLLAMTGLAFFFGGHINDPVDEKKSQDHSAAEQIEEVKASIAAAVEAVVDGASDLVESVSEEIDKVTKPAAKPRPSRRRAPKAKPAG